MQSLPLAAFMFIWNNLVKWKHWWQGTNWNWKWFEIYNHWSHWSFMYNFLSKHINFTGWKTLYHIPCEILWYMYLYLYLYAIIKQEVSRLYGILKFLKYQALLIPSWGQKVHVLFTFDCQENIFWQISWRHMWTIFISIILLGI